VNTPSPPSGHLTSLRARLARRVLVPLALVWLAGTTITVSAAYYFAAQAFDRSLLDDAYALAAQVQATPQGLEVKLTSGDLSTLLFDQSESIYFAVLRRDGTLVSGHPWLRVERQSPDAEFEFSNSSYMGKSLRVASVYRDDEPGYQVIMAQTTRSRTALLQRVLLYSLLPQALLLLLLEWWLRRAIASDLQPLSDLQSTLNQRDATDLTPIPVHTSSRDMAQVGNAINSLMGRVQDGVRAQREFAGNVAHELRTPLAGIRALAEYGLKQTDPAIWKRQLQAIAASEVRASHMVEQLLALALADETRDSLRLHPVALDALVARVVLQYLARADALGVELVVSGAESSVSVQGDEGLIEGVLGNLLDNALRYGRPVDGAPATITIELQNEPASVALLVRDNGPGIAAGARQDLAHRWQQQASTGIDAGQGVGLGLSIVARYATVLHARFTMESNRADGAGLCAGLRWDRAPTA
jgi:two-component system sensor histidine kinase TctE